MRASSARFVLFFAKVDTCTLIFFIWKRTIAGEDSLQDEAFRSAGFKERGKWMEENNSLEFFCTYRRNL